MAASPDDEVELLARVEARAGLPFRKVLRLYLDPFALFKNVNAGNGAAQHQALAYNRSHRGMLLVYAKRWALIGLACVAALLSLSSFARAEPALLIPMLGLELVFSTAVVVLFLSVAVYLVLGIERGRL